MNKSDSTTQREDREPRNGSGKVRFWLFGICGLAVIIGGAFIVRSWGFSDTRDDRALPKVIAPAEAAPAAQVAIRSLQFDPVTVEVKKGDVVEWKNDDLVPHTATATPASFNSGTIASGQSWRYTFTQAGNYPYVCTFHPQMKGVVIVK